MRVREAMLKDTGLFRKLWMEYLTESNNAYVSNILADEHNLNLFTTIFQQYVTGEKDGVVLFVGNDAVIMQGSIGESPFHTNMRKQANGWGTYVRPKRRRQGIATLLRDEAVRRLRALGFDVSVGVAHESNTVGIESMKHRNASTLTMYIIPLEEPKDEQSDTVLSSPQEEPVEVSPTTRAANSR